MGTVKSLKYGADGKLWSHILGGYEIINAVLWVSINDSQVIICSAFGIPILVGCPSQVPPTFSLAPWSTSKCVTITFSFLLYKLSGIELTPSASRHVLLRFNSLLNSTLVDWNSVFSNSHQNTHSLSYILLIFCSEYIAGVQTAKRNL